MIKQNQIQDLETDLEALSMLIVEAMTEFLERLNENLELEEPQQN